MVSSLLLCRRYCSLALIHPYEIHDGFSRWNTASWISLKLHLAPRVTSMKTGILSFPHSGWGQDFDICIADALKIPQSCTKSSTCAYQVTQSIINPTTLMAEHKTMLSPLRMHWKYCSLALSHQSTCSFLMVCSYYRSHSVVSSPESSSHTALRCWLRPDTRNIAEREQKQPTSPNVTALKCRHSHHQK